MCFDPSGRKVFNIDFEITLFQEKTTVGNAEDPERPTRNEIKHCDLLTSSPRPSPLLLSTDLDLNADGSAPPFFQCGPTTEF